MRRPVCQYGFVNADLRGHGCTLASITYLAREMTDGAAWVDAEAFAKRMQELSGVSLATFRERGTTLTEGRVAYEQAPGFEGRVKPRLSLQRGIDVRDGLLPMLAAGRIALVAVNYGVVQDEGKGVGSFRGGHAVVIGEPDGQRVTVADPLRRELVQWRIGTLVRAMESFGKRPWMNGRGEAAIPLPSPTFLEQRTAQRDKAIRERDKALADLAACRAATPSDCTATAQERDGALERAALEADRALAAEGKLDAIRAVLSR